MDKEEALKILGFSSSDNPNKQEIIVAYRKLARKHHPDRHSDASKDVQKQNEEKFKELGAAYCYLTAQNLETIVEMADEEDVIEMTDEEFAMFMKETMRCCTKNLDEINSADDLSFSLRAAILGEDVEYLKRLFSKFKSSKDGQFGDYINKPCERIRPLFLAILSKDIEIIELLLKNGADPNTKINQSCLWNRKIKKLLAEYGRIDKLSIFCQLIFASLPGYAALATYRSCDTFSFDTFSSCYAKVAAFALVAVFPVVNAIHSTFFAKTQKPSPDFDEVNVEQVINSQEQGAAGSSRNVWV